MRVRGGRRSNSLVETIEARLLLSAAVGRFEPSYVLYHPSGGRAPQASASPFGLTPSQVRTAYGVGAIRFGSVVGDGSGQTIAIIDAYHAPTIAQDLAAFDAAFGLPAPPSFWRVAQDGSTTCP